MRTLKVWWYLISSIGPAMRAGRQADQFFRYYVLNTLENAAFFDYLKEPRTYGQIVSEFGFVDSDYTREMLNILVADEKKVLEKEDEFYRVSPQHNLLPLDQIMKRVDKRIRTFVLLAEGMARNVLPRLRDEPIIFSDTFEEDGRQFLTKFDTVLGNQIYSAMRAASFAYLSREDVAGITGKSLLDIGCGSGRETAELWLKFKGDIHITAIDPVASMLKLAEQNFESIVKNLEPDHPPITEANHPVYEISSATKLPFEDNTFDAAFWLFILHWTPNPRRAVQEAVRVLKPGGIIFGAQAFKPEANPYFDLMIRTSENCYGFFWREDYRRWFGEHGLEIDMTTPAGIFRVRKEAR